MDLERKEKVIWTGAEWKGGEWKGDIWESGTFIDGIFSGRTWKNGVFKGGVFKGQIWENGIWYGGIWAGEIWKKGYDSYGHLLEIPPDEWPDDQSLLCSQASVFEAFKCKFGPLTISKENNLFYRQSIRKAREILKKGVFLFHPDAEQNEVNKEEKSKLFRVFMTYIESHDLSAAEKMIEEAKKKAI